VVRDGVWSWSKLRPMLNKLEKFIFYLFLFSIPIQTRMILGYSSWQFDEWQSMSIFGTDILFGILIVFCIVNLSKRFTIYDLRFTNKFLNLKSLFINPNFWLFLFVIISAFSIKNSTDTTISWYSWIKLLELVALYYYISAYALKKFGLVNSFLSILSGGVFQSIIAIIQFVKQLSLGLRYLGESVLNSELTGIASFYLPTGEKIIRSYGTTPHPNVLAVTLFLSLFAFYFAYLYSRLHAEHQPLADKWDKILLLAESIILFAFFSTFSRTVIFAWFMSFVVRIGIIISKKNNRIVFGTVQARKRIRAILISSGIVIATFGSIYFQESTSRLILNSGDQAVELRVFYAKEAIGSNLRMSGVGIGNFVGWLKEKEPFLLQFAYQPVHNLYLLIYSETGLFGIISFIFFIYLLFDRLVRHSNLQLPGDISIMVFVASLLFTGLFDHMFWTLQQGRLVFWISLGILTFMSKSDINKSVS